MIALKTSGICGCVTLRLEDRSRWLVAYKKVATLTTVHQSPAQLRTSTLPEMKLIAVIIFD